MSLKWSLPSPNIWAQIAQFWAQSFKMVQNCQYPSRGHSNSPYPPLIVHEGLHNLDIIRMETCFRQFLGYKRTFTMLYLAKFDPNFWKPKLAVFKSLLQKWSILHFGSNMAKFSRVNVHNILKPGWNHDPMSILILCEQCGVNMGYLSNHSWVIDNFGQLEENRSNLDPKTC